MCTTFPSFKMLCMHDLHLLELFCTYVCDTMAEIWTNGCSALCWVTECAVFSQRRLLKYTTLEGEKNIYIYTQ